MKKLQLKKEVVARLDDDQMSQAKGGAVVKTGGGICAVLTTATPAETCAVPGWDMINTMVAACGAAQTHLGTCLSADNNSCLISECEIC